MSGREGGKLPKLRDSFLKPLASGHARETSPLHSLWQAAGTGKIDSCAATVAAAGWHRVVRP